MLLGSLGAQDPTEFLSWIGFGDPTRGAQVLLLALAQGLIPPDSA